MKKKGLHCCGFRYQHTYNGKLTEGGGNFVCISSVLDLYFLWDCGLVRFLVESYVLSTYNYNRNTKRGYRYSFFPLKLTNKWPCKYATYNTYSRDLYTTHLYHQAGWSRLQILITYIQSKQITFHVTLRESCGQKCLLFDLNSSCISTSCTYCLQYSAASSPLSQPHPVQSSMAPLQTRKHAPVTQQSTA